MKNLNEYSKDEQDRMKRGNRYAKIHILFRELAKLKVKDSFGKRVTLSKSTAKLSEITAASFKIKRFWKDFFGVESLTDLSNQQLVELEEFVGKRIKHESKH